jgi:uncharacterized RDD family membrane protein YckC
MTDSQLQQKRLIAAAIDIGISIVISCVFWAVALVLGFVLTRASGGGGGGRVALLYVPRVLGFLGAAIGLGYVLGRDLLGGGRSLGKKLQNIRVVTASGAPIGAVDSIKRNAIFAIGSAFGMLSATLQLVPCLGDVVACVILPLAWLGYVVSLVAVIVELVKITQDPAGIRLGDQFAATRVVS